MTPGPNTAAAVSLPLNQHMIGADTPESEPDPVWTAWLARGIAQERVVTRRFNRLATALCIVFVAALVYSWLG